MICIVKKIELVSGSLSETPVGYITNSEDCDTINENYNKTFGSWLHVNKTRLQSGAAQLEEFFNVTPFVYNAMQQKENIDGLGLELIEDINTL